MPSYQDYQQLEKLPKAEANDKAKWYEHTYQIFINHPLNDMNDFWKIVAFAYSWMPTIPNIDIQKSKLNDDLEFWKTLMCLKNGLEVDRKWLLEKLVPNINNSVVGTSKVLHFIAPDYVPILDRKVLENWNCFFKNRETKTFAKNLTASNQIDIYLEYWQLMEEWKLNCQKSGKKIPLRELEKGLFTLKNDGEAGLD